MNQVERITTGPGLDGTRYLEKRGGEEGRNVTNPSTEGRGQVRRRLFQARRGKKYPSRRIAVCDMNKGQEGKKGVDFNN